jgi:hypothetical protein
MTRISISTGSIGSASPNVGPCLVFSSGSKTELQRSNCPRKGTSSLYIKLQIPHISNTSSAKQSSSSLQNLLLHSYQHGFIHYLHPPSLPRWKCPRRLQLQMSRQSRTIQRSHLPMLPEATVVWTSSSWRDLLSGTKPPGIPHYPALDWLT